MSYFYTTRLPFAQLFRTSRDLYDQPRGDQSQASGERSDSIHPLKQLPRRTQKRDTFIPAADIYSSDSEYKVYLSLPSADKESIELQYNPNIRELSIVGNLIRPAAFSDLDDEALKTVLVQAERKIGKFERKLKIPRDEESIRFGEATATFDNGVLELTLPKAEKKGLKRIVID